MCAERMDWLGCQTHLPSIKFGDFMRIIFAAFVFLTAVIANADQSSLSCYNPATKAAASIRWNPNDELSGFVQFNHVLSKALYDQGVEFPEGAYWGKVLMNKVGFVFSDFQPFAPKHSSHVEVKSHNNGVLLVYESPMKNKTANFFFNHGECK